MEKMDIHAFPTEVLLKILSLLPDVDLKSLKELTPQLERIINEGIGFRAAIGTNSPFASKLSPTLDWPDKVFARGVSKCWVADLTETIDEPSFKYPTIVKELYFEGPITQINFNSLLTPLTGLQHLTLHFSALTYPGLHLADGILSDCILQSFTLTSTKCEQAMRSTSKMYLTDELLGAENTIQENITRFTKNCITLFKNLRSSRLKVLILSMPLLKCAEVDLMTSIVQCISRHGQTLRNVQIYLECVCNAGLRNWDPDYDYGNYEDLDEQVLTTKEYKIDWTVFKATNLRRFSFANCDHTKLTCDPEMIELIRCQQNLSEFYFMNRGQNSDESFILKDMTPKNLSTLKKLLIHMNTVPNHTHGRDNPLDLEIFLQCPNLQYLILRGEPTILTENKPAVKNTRMLPRSISLLSIRDILVSTIDAVDILGLERTKRIRLINIGCTEEFGLPLKNLFAVMDNNDKKLEEFEFTNSINLETLNWRLNVMQMCLVQKLQAANKLHAILDLNSDGMHKEYFIKDGDMFDYSNEPENLRANDICNIVFK